MNATDRLAEQRMHDEQVAREETDREARDAQAQYDRYRLALGLDDERSFPEPEDFKS